MGKVTIVEQRSIKFYDDEIPTVLVDEDGEQIVYVPLRPICDFLGVSWSGQFERLQRDAVLSESTMSVRVTRTDMPGDSSRPNASDMLCLPLDYLNGWLFGINANRVKSEVRKRVLTYQRECYRILAKAYNNTSAQATGAAPVISGNAYGGLEMARAVLALAEEQVEAEARIGDNTRRIEALEALVTPGQTITEEQASLLSQAVKTVAMSLGKKYNSNQFGSVYAELYRKFGITSYKLLPQARFKEAIDWLTEWHQSIDEETF